MFNYKNTLIFGFTLFSMFFGSGNLIFPLQIGQLTGSNWLYGFLGLMLTGILLPFLGLFVIKLYKGNYNDFFGEAGPTARIILPLFILSLLGSFGIIPRCITVAHGGFVYLFPEIPLYIFSVVFCSLIFLLCLKDKIMINILGKWLSPIKMGTMLILILVCASNAPTTYNTTTIKESMSIGFMTGYQTMDLFAAFFFSSFIFKRMQSLAADSLSDKYMILHALKPSLIGATLLSLIYLGLVYIGAHYASLLEGIAPQLMLPTISMHVMGDKATIFIAFTMLFSCLATAVALNNIYANYLLELFQYKPDKFPIILFFTTLMSFVVSLFNFTGIASFLSPILEYSYPAIIVLTLLCIISRNYQKLKMMMFWSVVVIVVIQKILI